MLEQVKRFIHFSFQVNRREIGFPEFFDELRPLKTLNVFLFLPFDRVKVIDAIISDRLDEISLSILDLLLFGIEPLDKGFLDNILRVRFAFENPHCNRVKSWLIEDDCLCWRHERKFKGVS
jgi:hypothetical protein